MASLPLYRVKSYIRAPKWAKFPEDFDIVGHSILDDNLIDHPDIASHRWSMKMPGKKSRISRARRMATIDGKRVAIDLHCVVWKIVNGEVPKGLTIDHKNRDSLDNRVENLRLATQSQQGANIGLKASNSIGFKGVHICKASSRRPTTFTAYIHSANYGARFLGNHPTLYHAAFAYNCAAIICYNEFAVPNEIPDGLVPVEDQIKIQEYVKKRLAVRKLIDSKSLQTSSHA